MRWPAFVHSNRQTKFVNILLLIGWMLVLAIPAFRFYEIRASWDYNYLGEYEYSKISIVEARALLEAVSALDETSEGEGKWSRFIASQKGVWIQKDSRKLFVPVWTRNWGYEIGETWSGFSTVDDRPVVVIQKGLYLSCSQMVNILARDFSHMKFELTKMSSDWRKLEWVPVVYPKTAGQDVEACEKSGIGNSDTMGFRLIDSHHQASSEPPASPAR